MTFRVSLSETAVHQLRRVPGKTRNRIVRALRLLAEDPFRRRSGTDIRSIQGTDPRKYRLRVGKYRTVYAVVGTEGKIIEVFVRGRGYR